MGIIPCIIATSLKGIAGPQTLVTISVAIIDNCRQKSHGIWWLFLQIAIMICLVIYTVAKNFAENHALKAHGIFVLII